MLYEVRFPIARLFLLWGLLLLRKLLWLWGLLLLRRSSVALHLRRLQLRCLQLRRLLERCLGELLMLLLLLLMLQLRLLRHLLLRELFPLLLGLGLLLHSPMHCRRRRVVKRVVLPLSATTPRNT